jgi:hypothetical protein
MKKVIKFLFNIPGKSFWAIMNVIMMTSVYFFIGMPATIVEWVQSTDEDSDLKEDLKDLWGEYTHEMGSIFSEAINDG